MRPYFSADMCACTARVIRKEPRRCTLMTASQSSTVILKMRLSRMMPALLTRIVGAPSSCATRATAASTCSGRLTSTPTAIARPPAAVMADTVSPQACSSRSSTATAWPSAASRRAVAAPMPRAAPVTMAVRWVVLVMGASRASYEGACGGRGGGAGRRSGEGGPAGGDERGDQLAHPVEAGSDGLAGEVPGVDALADHGELVVAQRDVPGEWADVEAGAGG